MPKPAQSDALADAVPDTEGGRRGVSESRLPQMFPTLTSGVTLRAAPPGGRGSSACDGGEGSVSGWNLPLLRLENKY